MTNTALRLTRYGIELTQAEQDWVDSLPSWCDQELVISELFSIKKGNRDTVGYIRWMSRILKMHKPKNKH
jgi:hypothetical protein